jgi:hypothetical protein
MTRSPQRQAPAGYRLRVAGHLDDHWTAWFGGLILTHESDGTTSLSGVVSDQAQLHGLLMKVRDLGVILISVEAIDPYIRQSAPGRTGAGLRQKPVEHTAAIKTMS